VAGPAYDGAAGLQQPGGGRRNRRFRPCDLQGAAQLPVAPWRCKQTASNVSHLKGPAMLSTAWYAGFAKSASRFCGHPSTFVLAVAVIAVWLITGPLFAFSDTWQLVINTGTTIITFLMVFLIQNTQNRDTQAIQIKLDELIRATKGAHNALLDLEELEEAALSAFRTKYQSLAAAARTELSAGLQDTGTPEL
jgi:low affinity Fe/Cu permease